MHERIERLPASERRDRRGGCGQVRDTGRRIIVAGTRRAKPKSDCRRPYRRVRIEHVRSAARQGTELLRHSRSRRQKQRNDATPSVAAANAPRRFMRVPAISLAAGATAYRRASALSIGRSACASAAGVTSRPHGRRDGLRGSRALLRRRRFRIRAVTRPFARLCSSFRRGAVCRQRSRFR